MLRLGKLRIKLRERSGLKLTVAFKFLLAASLTADTIFPLKAKGKINNMASKAPKLIPVYLAIFFQFIIKSYCKNTTAKRRMR